MDEKSDEKPDEKPDKPELTGRAKRREAKLRFQPASIIASEETDTRIDVAEVRLRNLLKHFLVFLNS